MSQVDLRRRPVRGGAEDGGIVTGWLMQLVMLMAVLAFIGYEVISVAVTSINLQDDARDVAVDARDAFGRDRDRTSAQRSAERSAEALGVTLVSLETDEQYVHATVTTQADTLFVHRIGALDGLTTPTATGRVRWRP